jgi:hypothetical protein
MSRLTIEEQRRFAAFLFQEAQGFREMAAQMAKIPAMHLGVKMQERLASAYTIVAERMVSAEEQTLEGS